MKISEIQVGKCYGNGKGRVRKVAKIVKDGYFSDVYWYSPKSKVRYGPIFLNNFAAWAKEEVKCP